MNPLNSILKKEQLKLLTKLMKNLRRREFSVLILRQTMTFREVGGIIKRSGSRVREIYLKAIRKIKRAAKIANVTFLDFYLLTEK